MKSRPVRLLIFLCLAVLILAACAAPVRVTEQNQSTSQPSFTPAHTTPTRVPTLTATPYPPITPMPLISGSLSGETPRSLCLDLTQPSALAGEPIPGELEGQVAQMLRVNGFDVVQDPAACDAALEIALVIQALSADYSGTRCYTGASAQGIMTLTPRSGSQVKVNFDGGISPPFVVTNCPDTKAGAPTQLAVSKALFEGFSQLWSFEFLANVIRRADVPAIHRNMAAEVCGNQTIHQDELVVPCLVATAEELYNRSADALNHLKYLEGKAITAVPALIRMLEPSLKPTPTLDAFTYMPGQKDQKEYVLAALIAITGQDFGADTVAWNNWWQTASLALTVTPVPCAEYQQSMGKVIQVSGSLDYFNNDQYGTWIDLIVDGCSYNVSFLPEVAQTLDPSTLASLQVGDKLVVTGTVTDWIDGWTILDGLSIDSVEH